MMDKKKKGEGERERERERDGKSGRNDVGSI